MSGTDYGTGKLPVSVDPTAWFGRTFTPDSPLDVGTVMTEVVTKVTSYFATDSFLSTLSVYQFPDYDLDTWWSGGTPAFVLVAYVGTSYSKPLDTSAMWQERTIDFDIFVIARQVSWATFNGSGPFYIVDMLERGLTGYRPTGCRNAYFTDERFTEQDPEGRVWLYRMKYNVITMRAKLANTPNLANMTQLTALVASLGDQTTASYVVTNGVLTLPTDTVVVSVVNATTGVTYQLGIDYNLDSITGALTTIASGSLGNGVTVNVTTAATETYTSTGS